MNRTFGQTYPFDAFNRCPLAIFNDCHIQKTAYVTCPLNNDLTTITIDKNFRNQNDLEMLKRMFWKTKSDDRRFDHFIFEMLWNELPKLLYIISQFYPNEHLKFNQFYQLVPYAYLWTIRQSNSAQHICWKQRERASVKTVVRGNMIATVVVDIVNIECDIFGI